MTCKNCFAFNRMQREKERLLAIVKRYATAARAIALHLDRFCNRAMPYDEMIADAARKAAEEIERLEFVRERAEARVNEKLADKDQAIGMLYELHDAAIKENKVLVAKLQTFRTDAVKEFAKYLLDNYSAGGVIAAVDVIDAAADWGRGNG